jgi:hypothetical protein
MTVAIIQQRMTDSQSARLKRAMKRVQAVEEQTVFDAVPIDKIFADAYTRPVSAVKVKAMAENFDTDKIGAIMLSLRDDGRYAVIDGHHRLQAARIAGVETVPARVYIDLTYEEEAELFVAFGTIKQPSAADRFRARLESKEAGAINIRAILLKHGMDVNLDSQASIPNTTRAVAALDKIDRLYGGVVLDGTLALLRECFGDEDPAFHHLSLMGTATFWARYRLKIERDKLVVKLKKLGVNRLVRAAESLREVGEVPSPPIAFAKAILYEYNRSRSHKVEWIERLITERVRESYSAIQRKKSGRTILEQQVLAALGERGSSILDLSERLKQRRNRIDRTLEDLKKRGLVREAGKDGRHTLWARSLV